MARLEEVIDFEEFRLLWYPSLRLRLFGVTNFVDSGALSFQS
jgi:hypothetical protein